MLSIIVLTLAVSAATAPLTFVGMRSQRRLAVIQPELQNLQRRHSKDRAQLAAATTELFRRHNVSPLGGCVPMLVQAPVFILMFRHVQHLAAHGMSFAGVDLAQTGLAALYAGPAAVAMTGVVLVLIIGASVLQLCLSPSTTPAAQRTPVETAMRMSSLFFGAWAVSLPLAVGVYYAISSVFRVSLQWAFTRHLSA